LASKFGVALIVTAPVELLIEKAPASAPESEYVTASAGRVGTREEIMLLFGANQAWHGGQKEVTVVLSDRIVLNPYAAKRLMSLLQQGLKEYESRYGELKL